MRTRKGPRIVASSWSPSLGLRARNDLSRLYANAKSSGRMNPTTVNRDLLPRRHSVEQDLQLVSQRFVAAGSFCPCQPSNLDFDLTTIQAAPEVRALSREFGRVQNLL